MYNVESKKLLAKLLAEENILVEFKKTTTAGFDTAKRTLILPILKEGLSEDIITLFIMHEVGHALFTPNEEWIACLETHKKSIVNILEDVRIERKIQVRYPGSKSNFIKGYGELNSDRDFFSIRDEDVNELNFLNRLNLYTKLGPSLLINFNPQEYKYVLKAFETETFEDVLSLSKEIEELLKEKIDSESKEKEETSKTKSSEDGEEIDSEEEGSEEEFDDYDEDSDGENGAEYFPTEEDEFEASTLDSLQDNFDTLISDDCLEREYINVNVVDSKPFIVPHKEIINKIKFYYANQYQGLQTSKEYKLYSKFLTENSSTIQYLINEFNINKNAKNLRKEKRSKTGNLDIKKIHNYVVSDKLFKNIQIVEKEKSHGLVLFLDWSGSMAPYFNDTIKQLLNLLIFCKKLSIPFEVYAFSESYFRYTQQRDVFYQPDNFKCLGTAISKKECSLLNLFSSSMKEMDFKFMSNLLLSMTGYYLKVDLSFFDESTFGENFDPSWHAVAGVSVPEFIGLYRTPLDHTIILAMDIVPKFKQLHKVDKVQTIFLTDGETSPNIRICSNVEGNYTTEFDSEYSLWRQKHVIFREPKSKIESKTTKMRISFNGKRGYNNYFDVTSTTALFNILKQKLEDNIISYRIISPKDLTSNRLNYYFDKRVVSESTLLKLKQNLDKQKYISVENMMHTKSFLVKSSSLAIDDSELKIDSTASTKKIAKSFSNSISKKICNRLFLSDFVRLIS